jgi:hypothetical protein
VTEELELLKRTIDAVRRNHALEHATIAVMLGRQGPMRVVGRASPDGFFVWANVATDKLREFASEALARLQRGEAHLAVSPLCGTNLVVAGVLAGGGAYAAAAMGRRSSGAGRLDGLSGAVFAALLGVIAAQPLGRLLQKHYTTRPDLEGIEIVAVERIGRSGLHKVRTRAAAV